MSLHDRVVARENGAYPRQEITAVNNTGKVLTASDIGLIVCLDWLPSGSNMSAITPSTAAIVAGYRKAVILDLLSGGGKIGQNIRVLLQGEVSLQIANSITAKSPLAVGTVVTAGGASAAAVVATAIGTAGSYGQTIVGAALAANASGSVTLTSCFFDGTDINSPLVKD